MSPKPMKQNTASSTQPAAEELRLSSILEATSDFVGIANPQGQALFLNKSGRRLIGLDNGVDITSLSIADFHPQWATDIILKVGLPTAAEQGLWEGETALLHHDGHEISVSQVITAHKNEQGDTHYFSTIIRDITERKRTEEALRKSEARYQALIESQIDLISRYLPDTNLTFVNDAFCRFYGKTREELIGRSFLTMVAPEFHEQALKNIESMTKTSAPIISEALNYRWDGQECWIQWVVQGIADENGQVVELQAIGRDITRLKQVEQIIRQSEARYRALVESQIDLISRYLPDTNLTFVNDAFCRFYGKTREELIGRSFLTMVAPEFHERALKETESFLKDPRPVEGEYLNYRWDSQECWIHWIIRGIADENGQVVEIQATGRDITRLKQVEQIIRQSEENYRDLYENAPNGYLSVNREGLVGRCNRYLVEMLGYNSADEIVGRPVEELYADTPHGKSRVLQIFQDIGVGGTVRDEELQMQKRDGTPVWISLTTNAESDGEGQFCWTRSMVVNITERKRAEEALRQSEERFAKAFRASPFGLVITRLADGKIIEVNDSWEGIFGYSSAELVGQTSLALNLFKDPADRQRAIAQMQEQGSLRDFELEIKRKSGEARWINVAAEMIEINNEPCSITIVNDITERKRVGEALQLQSERLKLLSEIDRAILAAASASDIAEVVLKKIRRLIPSRRASIIMFDYERQEILAFAVDFDGHTQMPSGKAHPLNPEILALFPSDRVEVIPDIRELANPPQAIVQLRSEGIVSILGAPLLMHGELRGRLNLSSDMPHAFTSEHHEIAGQVAMQLAIALQQNQLYEQTRLHAIELEQRVYERTAQLEAANKELEAFAYSISHDLRAPLRAIDGFTRILEEDYEPFLDTEGQRVCAVIRRQTQRMGELIDNLLTFSRLSRVSMRISLIHMGALAQSIFYELTTPEDRERIDFLVEPLPVAVGDPNLIRQVWTNLLTNALKFSAKRERAIIEVGSRREGGEIIYSVRDNGAGFDMQYANKLFGVFQRLHSEREFAGTGVGLAIIQRVIHRHGGRIWAEGELDRGATFYFTLPQHEE